MSDKWQDILKKGFRTFEKNPIPLIDTIVISTYGLLKVEYSRKQLEKDIERHNRLKEMKCTFIDKVKYYQEGINVFNL